MKQLLLFACFLFAGRAAFSQTYKGQWLAGGSGSLSRVTSPRGYADRFKYTFINVSPDEGFFILTNLAIGARFGLDYTSSRTTNSDTLYYKYRNAMYSAAPFVRYYFLKATHRVNILADAAYRWYWTGNKNDNITSKTNNKGYAFAAGAAWFISTHSSLDLTAGYAHSNDFFSNRDFSLNIGFHQHLGKAHLPKKA